MASLTLNCKGILADISSCIETVTTKWHYFRQQRRVSLANNGELSLLTVQKQLAGNC